MTPFRTKQKRKKKKLERYLVGTEFLFSIAFPLRAESFFDPFLELKAAGSLSFLSLLCQLFSHPSLFGFEVIPPEGF